MGDPLPYLRAAHFAATIIAAGVVIFPARGLGRTEIVINAHPTSLSFYLAHGYREGEWRDAAPVPANLIRVGKRLS